jgi:hypothetical protein
MSRRYSTCIPWRWGVLLTGAALALGCGGDDPTPKPTTGSISGTVLDPQRATAVAGATVTTEPSSVTVTTDADGAFMLAGVSPGTYLVIVTVDGVTYAQFHDVVVTAGTTTELQPDALDRVYPTTCLDCHLDRDALIASLEADPLPVDTEAGSAGEG